MDPKVEVSMEAWKADATPLSTGISCSPTTQLALS